MRRLMSAVELAQGNDPRLHRAKEERAAERELQRRRKEEALAAEKRAKAEAAEQARAAEAAAGRLPSRLARRGRDSRARGWTRSLKSTARSSRRGSRGEDPTWRAHGAGWSSPWTRSACARETWAPPTATRAARSSTTSASTSAWRAPFSATRASRPRRWSARRRSTLSASSRRPCCGRTRSGPRRRWARTCRPFPTSSSTSSAAPTRCSPSSPSPSLTPSRAASRCTEASTTPRERRGRRLRRRSASAQTCSACGTCPGITRRSCHGRTHTALAARDPC
mmetsp:Transcript_49280/g.159735  ORF Transcript_49280/g.159735 Transcript_49280/m.159735 type:complete len:280 (+) Transcript_49280:499-1338(+)